TIQTVSKIKPQLDIIGFDACFMAMVEIAYELRKAARYILAPQASIGLEGWHYDLLLDHILHNDAVTAGPKLDRPLELGRAAVQQVGLRKASPQSLTLLETAHAEDVVTQLKTLFDVIATALSNPHAESGLRHEVLAAFNAALWAGVRQFLDLPDLCRQLAGRISEQVIRESAMNVLAELAATVTITTKPGTTVIKPDRLVVDQLTTLGLPLGGVSIYSPFPRATACEVRDGVRNVEIDIVSYVLLSFVRDTGYFKIFLHPNNFVAAERRWIRREVRDGMGSVASELYRAMGPGGRDPDSKPSSREPDSKPAGREPDPKPAGRGDNGGRTHYD
ncbi:MAG: clostripain-related cysteine peptidase, partial [bacterium]